MYPTTKKGFGFFCRDIRLLFTMWMLFVVFIVCLVLFWGILEFQNFIINSFVSDNNSILELGAWLGDYSAIIGNFAAVFAALSLICTLAIQMRQLNTMSAENTRIVDVLSGIQKQLEQYGRAMKDLEARLGIQGVEQTFFNLLEKIDSLALGISYEWKTSQRSVRVVSGLDAFSKISKNIFYDKSGESIGLKKKILWWKTKGLQAYLNTYRAALVLIGQSPTLSREDKFFYVSLLNSSRTYQEQRCILYDIFQNTHRYQGLSAGFLVAVFNRLIREIHRQYVQVLDGVKNLSDDDTIVQRQLRESRFVDGTIYAFQKKIASRSKSG